MISMLMFNGESKQETFYLDCRFHDKKLTKMQSCLSLLKLRFQIIGPLLLQDLKVTSQSTKLVVPIMFNKLSKFSSYWLKITALLWLVSIFYVIANKLQFS